MDIQALLHMIKPNTANLGYALFIAINAAGLWGGVFPFLPMDIQTHDVLFWFFLAQSFVFSLCYFVSAVGVYYFPGPTRKFLVTAATLPYFLGWCCLIAAMYIHEAILLLVVIGGGLLGLGSAGFYMLWQRLFASSEPDRGNLDLICGTAYGAILYFCLYVIPQAVTTFLIPVIFLPLFALACILKSREINLDQPMFEDIPRENNQVYRAVLHDYWRSAFCVGALGFCTGIMRSLAIEQPQVGSLVNLLSMAASLLAAVLMLYFWQTRSLRFNVVGIYRMAFPFLMTSLCLLPFLTLEYVRWLAAVLYALYSVAIMLMMIQCAQASRDRGINPIFIYGFFGGVIYTLHEVGFLAGTFSEQTRILGIDPLVITTLVSLYLLAIMFFIAQGGFKPLLARTSLAENVELVMLRNVEGENRGVVARMDNNQTDSEYADEKQQGAPHITDRLSKQVQALRVLYGLSAREAEVMEYVARGYTVTNIATELIVSENTIRTHTKRIYTKLGVHKKRELVEMLENVNLRQDLNQVKN